MIPVCENCEARHGDPYECLSCPVMEPMIREKHCSECERCRSATFPFYDVKSSDSYDIFVTVCLKLGSAVSGSGKACEYFEEKREVEPI